MWVQEQVPRANGNKGRYAQLLARSIATPEERKL